MVEINSTVNYQGILNFPGYRVGDDGSVWSCRRRGKVGDKWRKLNPVTMANGHRAVPLCPGQKLCYVHRLVLEAFAGACPDGCEACHNDGNPSNNAIANLRWGTHKSNMSDMVQHGRSPRGERNGWSKLTPALIVAIRAKIATRLFRQREIAAMFNISQITVSRITRGETWIHLTHPCGESSTS